MDHTLSFRSVFEVTGADCDFLGNKAVLQVSLSICWLDFILHVAFHRDASCLLITALKHLVYLQFYDGV